jgi:hypothetical protein
VESRYIGRYVVRPGRVHAEIVVVDRDGSNLVEHELPIDVTGRPAWDYALWTLGWRRTGTWEPDELGFRSAVERSRAFPDPRLSWWLAACAGIVCTSEGSPFGVAPLARQGLRGSDL